MHNKAQGFSEQVGSTAYLVRDSPGFEEHLPRHNVKKSEMPSTFHLQISTLRPNKNEEDLKNDDDGGGRYPS